MTLFFDVNAILINNYVSPLYCDSTIRKCAIISLIRIQQTFSEHPLFSFSSDNIYLLV